MSADKPKKSRWAEMCLFAIMLAVWAYLLVDVFYCFGTEDPADGYISLRNIFAVNVGYMGTMYVLMLVSDVDHWRGSKLGRIICAGGAVLNVLGAMLCQVGSVLAA